MGEIVDGLDRERISALRASDRFFWLDVRSDELTRDEFTDFLGIPVHALEPLLAFGEDTAPSRKLHADGEHVVFVFTAFDGSRPIEVHVLVCGGFLLTVHTDRVSLPQLLQPRFPEGRSEQYLIYLVLDAMVITAFDQLNDIGNRLQDLQAAPTNRRTGQAMRDLSARLANLRRRIAPQRGTFERVSEEIDAVEGLETESDRYFERIEAQLTRLVDGIDAVSNASANLVDLRVNETMYRLTAVATVFLPLTFLTGFFGMNFKWLVDRIDTFGAFLVLGVGGCVLGAVLTVIVLRWDNPEV